MSPTSRLHLVVASLLYPAFLGNMLYLAIEKLDVRAALSASGLLVIFLLMHYVFDYVYTVINDEKNDYDLPAFICDLLIVIFLYLSLKTAVDAYVLVNTLDTTVGPIASEILFLPALWLALEKTAAFFWELRRQYKVTDQFKSRLTKIAVFALVTDSVMALSFMTIYFFSAYLSLWVLVVAVLIDVCLYVWHERKHGQWGDTPL